MGAAVLQHVLDCQRLGAGDGGNADVRLGDGRQHDAGDHAGQRQWGTGFLLLQPAGEMTLAEVGKFVGNY